MADADADARADQAVPGETVADDGDSRRRRRQSREVWWGGRDQLGDNSDEEDERNWKHARRSRRYSDSDHDDADEPERPTHAETRGKSPAPGDDAVASAVPAPIPTFIENRSSYGGRRGGDAGRSDYRRRGEDGGERGPYRSGPDAGYGRRPPRDAPYSARPPSGGPAPIPVFTTGGGAGGPGGAVQGQPAWNMQQPWPMGRPGDPALLSMGAGAAPMMRMGPADPSLGPMGPWMGMPVAAGMAMNMVPPGMGMFPMYGMPAAMGGAMPAPAEGREPGRGGRGRHGSRPDTDAGPSSTRGAADGERDAEGTEHAAGDGDAAADGGRSGSDTERDAAARAPGAPRHAAAGPPRPPAAPAGGRAGRSQRTPTAYITVINIPPENLSIQHISEHFSKFGTIVNVEINRKDRTAQLRYSSPQEATRAQRSAEAIFGNRFVKVFFGAASDAAEAAAAAAASTQDAAEPAAVAAAPAAAPHAATTGAPAPAAAPADGGAASSPSPVKAPAASTSPGRPLRGPAAGTFRPPPARPAPHAINAAEAQRRAALQAKQELQKKQSEILAETLAEHKKVMEQAQQLQASGGSPDAIRELVKRATELAELGKSLMAAALATAQAGPPAPSPSAGRPRPGGGRPVPPRPSSYKLDQRPTRILVRNLPESHRTAAALRQHFSAYGLIAAVELAADGTSAVVQFESRPGAETAMQLGQRIAEHVVSLSWDVPEPAAKPAAPSPQAGATAASSESASTGAASDATSDASTPAGQSDARVGASLVADGEAAAAPTTENAS